MISSINELYRILKIEKGLYLESSFKRRFINTFLKREYAILYKFVKLMRITDYFATNKNRNIFYRLMYLYCLRKYNSKCLKYGLLIGEGCFGPKSYATGEIHTTNHTFLIHHFAGSWIPKYERLEKKIWLFLGLKPHCIIGKVLNLFKR